MKKLRVYAIDTSSVSAMHELFPRKNFPQVWDLMDALVDRGQVTSVEDVLIELREGPSQALDWARKHRHVFWPLSTEIQRAARDVLARYPKLVSEHKPKSSADAFLIAHAQLTRATIVTEEGRSGGEAAKKIPDVCRALSIRCVKLLQLLQLEKLR